MLSRVKAKRSRSFLRLLKKETFPFLAFFLRLFPVFFPSASTKTSSRLTPSDAWYRISKRIELTTTTCKTEQTQLAQLTNTYIKKTGKWINMVQGLLLFKRCSFSYLCPPHGLGKKECYKSVRLVEEGNFLNVYDCAKAHRQGKRMLTRIVYGWSASRFLTTARKKRQRQKIGFGRKMRVTFS